MPGEHEGASMFCALASQGQHSVLATSPAHRQPGSAGQVEVKARQRLGSSESELGRGEEERRQKGWRGMRPLENPLHLPHPQHARDTVR